MVGFQQLLLLSRSLCSLVKILILGAWRWAQYEEAFARGLGNSGVDTIKLSTMEFFPGALGRLQLMVPPLAPGLLRLNRAAVAAARFHQPDWALFWRPTHFLPSTVRKLRGVGVATVSYNNDDPFGAKAHGKVPCHHHWLWHWYHKCLPWFDRNFFYRAINCREAKGHGAKHADLLLPYFLPWQDRPMTLSAADHARFGTEVVFAGHYEGDGRARAIRCLIQAGFTVRIWSGEGWGSALPDLYYDRMGPVLPALGEDYAKALCGAKVCLAFLSKLNRDTWTRRCFEIPACGRVLLAERTEDLMRLFKEGEEACFFSTPEELVQKTGWLLANPAIRERIARGGLQRVWADRHDVESRARDFLKRLRDERPESLEADRNVQD